MGERGVLLLDGVNATDLTDDQRRLVVEVAVLVGRSLEESQPAQQKQTATDQAIRQLLHAGVQAVSRMEAAQTLATTTAAVLGVSTACTYLVDSAGLISELATFGAAPGRDRRLRRRLLGAPAAGSPVWRRAAAGIQPGPDLITDTTTPGAVRPGGVAQVLGLRSMATIPLLSSDGPIGLVLCGDTGVPRRWTAHDRQLLEHLALQGTIVVDNARLREAERHEARLDALTGLANRNALHDALYEELQAAAGTNRRVAILQIDLDRFTEINDRFGHHEGDSLLIEVAARLAAAGSDAPLIARLGGDEFAILLTGNVDAAIAESAAATIGEMLRRPVRLAGREVTVEASIGVVLFPDHGTEVEQLLQRADRAVTAAKRSMLGHAVYRTDHDARMPADPGLLSELRRAIAEDELVLHYQPKVELATGRTVGVEALVRWNHPRLGLLGPDRFVPLAEGSPRIRSLTNWVVPHALHQLRQWNRQGLDLTVAVNVSTRDLTDPDFPGLVAGWLTAEQLPGDRLIIEVTEGTLMTDRLTASAVLTALRELGVQVSLDDFGTGYSSLARLHSLPIDEIKIDRSFLGSDPRQHTVIRAILHLAAGLGLRTVTEGIEDQRTADTLAELGSTLAQGFYFGRPVPPAALHQALRATPTRSGGAGAGL